MHGCLGVVGHVISAACSLFKNRDQHLISVFVSDDALLTSAGEGYLLYHLTMT